MVWTTGFQGFEQPRTSHMSSRQNTLHGLSTKSELIVSWGGHIVLQCFMVTLQFGDDKWIPKWIQFSTVLGRHHIPNQGGTSWLVTGKFERCRIISPMYHLHRTWDTWSSEGSGLSKIFRSFKRLAAGVSGPQSLMLIWYMDFGPVPFRNRFCEYLIIVWLSFRLSFYWASISGNIAKYWKTATKKYRTFKQIFAFTSRSGEGTCFPRSTWNPRSTFPGYRFWGGAYRFPCFSIPHKTLWTLNTKLNYRYSDRSSYAILSSTWTLGHTKVAGSFS